MEIKICQNKQEWDNWELARKPAEFLQSWDWGEFQRQSGKDVLRLQVVENGKVGWQGQGFAHLLGFGWKYLYVPRFIAFDMELTSVIKYCKENFFSFIRIEPSNLLRPTSYVLRPTKNRQPQNTLILDISKTEEQLLAAMHEKTRYNIRLAEKKGVVIKSEKDAGVFWQLNLATTERDKFKSHPKEYYKKMLENNFCHQLTAYYPFGSAQGKPIAAILLTVFGDTITYLHGVSGNEQRNLMAPYFLQLEGIKLGKKLGCQYYDFGGIAPDAKIGATTCFNDFCWPANHPWTGITRFKAGFGGERRDYPMAMDVVLSEWRYEVYRIFKNIKRYC